MRGAPNPKPLPKQRPKPETCEWIREEWDEEYFTTCGEAFCLNDGTLKDNSIRYCCYCGKPIKETIKRDEES